MARPGFVGHTEITLTLARNDDAALRQKKEMLEALVAHAREELCTLASMEARRPILERELEQILAAEPCKTKSEETGTASGPYRNDDAALRQKKAALESELSHTRDQLRTFDEAKLREARLLRELEAVDARIRGRNWSLPMLDDVRVAAPCDVPWDSMSGDEHVRFCGGCKKNVYNLSSLTRDAAEMLLAERENVATCIRFYRRADGTVITSDCPVGVEKRRKKRFVLSLVAGVGTLIAVETLVDVVTHAPRCPSNMAATQGLK